MSIAIRVKNLTKTFQIYDSPRDRIREAFRFWRKEPYFTPVDALKGLNFEIAPGQFIGFIGKNGAGKSTLLRILSGELAATAGEIDIRGQVSLLQLGVGFNNELSGRANARFAGRLQGHSPERIDQVVREVEAFADIGAFFDHPMKTYSSGMYSRLAFAVAVSVNPDILIADEVLAVGDLSFSQKCLRKMKEFREQGKTVILVSHDLGMVNSFCDHVFWIKDGVSFMEGRPEDVLEHFKNYMLYGRLPGEFKKSDVVPEVVAQDNPAFQVDPRAEWTPFGSQHGVIGEGGIVGLRTRLSLVMGKSVRELRAGDRVRIELEFQAMIDLPIVNYGIVAMDRHGQVLMHTNNEICGVPFPLFKSGQRGVMTLEIEIPGLAAGIYSIILGLQESSGEMRMLWRAHSVHELEVAKDPKFGDQCGLVMINSSRADIVVRD